MSKFYTPADFASNKKRSGYRYVAYKHADELPKGHGGGKPYVAEYKARAVPPPADAFRGPRRATALEAVTDLCNHLNGFRITITNNLRTAGHRAAPRKPLPKDPEIRAALGVLRDARAQRQGVQGYVYCIGERGCSIAVKVGYSTNPEKRVAELQTGNPRTLKLLAKKRGSENDERKIHTKHAHANILQEWFRPTPALLSEFGLTSVALTRR